MGLFKYAGEQCGTRKAAGFLTKGWILCAPCDLPDGMPQTVAQMGGAGATEPGAEFLYGEAFDHTGAAVGAGYWREFPCIIDETELKNMIEGSKQSTSVGTMASFIVPGFDEKHSAFVQSLNDNSGCAVLVFAHRNGTYPVVGSTDAPAFLEQSEGTAGKTNADVVGTTFNFKADTGKAFAFYPVDTLGINTTPKAA